MRDLIGWVLRWFGRGRQPETDAGTTIIIQFRDKRAVVSHRDKRAVITFRDKRAIAKMAIISIPPKDPNNVEPYFFIWCDRDGTNDGSASDNGELQGATISSFTVTAVTSGITVDSSNKNAVTIRGITYAISTVVAVWLSGGTAGTNYDVLCRIVTSDSRTLDQTIRVPVRTT